MLGGGDKESERGLMVFPHHCLHLQRCHQTVIQEIIKNAEESVLSCILCSEQPSFKQNECQLFHQVSRKPSQGQTSSVF